MDKNKEINTPSPVIIYVFGNGWMYGDKVIPSAIEPIIDLLKNEGYVENPFSISLFCMFI